MENNLNTRAPRPVGRPPNYQKQEAVPAVPDMTQRHVPPLTCPGCGRGMVPRVERWERDGSAACLCSLNGCRFNYTPATIRPK